MKKTLLFATALTAALVANAQNPIVPVDADDLAYFSFIPKAFADAPYLVEFGSNNTVAIYNGSLQQVSSFTVNRFEEFSILDFDENFPHTTSTIFFTQTLFNNDSHFEYISRVKDGEGYIVRFDIIADNGTVVNSIGNYGEMQETNAVLLVIQIGGNSYLRVSLINCNYYEWYRIDRQTQSITPVEALPFNVFPTVTDRSSDITVQFEDGASASELQVVDALGRTLKRIPVAPGQQEVKVSTRDLAPGMNLIGDRRHGAVKIIVR